MPILLSEGPIYSTFNLRDLAEAQRPGAVQVIQTVTSARPSGYRFMPAYKNGRWDGYIRLRRGASFPTGLLPRVERALKRAGYKVLTVRTPLVVEADLDLIDENMFDGIVLRPYQMEAARLLMSKGRGVAKMATNSGKTEVMAILARVLSGSVLVLTTKKDLLYQTAERLSHRLGESVGVIGDGRNEPRRVTVGMIQTLSKSLDKLKMLGHLDCVMYDECHHIPSKTSREVMLKADADMRFGFSGTPLRYDALDDLLLIAATGPILVNVTNTYLIKQGISAKPLILMVDVYDDEYYECDWAEAYDKCIVNNTSRNDTIIDAVTRISAPSTLILVDRLKHGLELQEGIIGAIFVHGSSPMSERQEALDLLRAGDGAIVVATPIFDEGVDVPAVNLLVLAGGGKTHIRLMQRIGRGMRRKEGDNTLRVLDFIDDTNEYLLQHSLARVKLYESEGFELGTWNASAQIGV